METPIWQLADKSDKTPVESWKGRIFKKKQKSSKNDAYLAGFALGLGLGLVLGLGFARVDWAVGLLRCVPSADRHDNLIGH